MSKKIGAIVSLVIIGLLIIATIVMANVSVNYSINCNKPDKIYVQYSSQSRELVNNEEQFNKILDFINNASKEKSLTALFNGNLNKKPELVTNSSTNGSAIPTTTGFYVSFVYNNPQTLMDGKKEHKDSEGNTYKFRELVFTVTNTNDNAVVRVYVKPFYDNNGQPTQVDTYTRSYNLTADFKGLYDYLVEKDFNK